MQLFMFLLYICCLTFIFRRVASSPIWAGEVVREPSFPYFVSIEVCGLILCGGSIVHPYFVITAAHCFDDFRGKSFYKIRAGALAVGKHGTTHTIQNLERHPHYDIETNLNDIALIRVGEKFTLDNFRQPVRLFRAGESVKSKTEAIVIGSGWTERGPTNRLIKASVLIVERSECNSTWINEDGSPIPDSVICAGVGNDRRDTCDNDSGGPLIVGGRLAGITSFGYHKCGTPGIPSLYTEVARFQTWIDDRIAVIMKSIGKVDKSTSRKLADEKICHYPKVKKRLSSKHADMKHLADSNNSL